MGRRKRESETEARALPWVTYTLACCLVLGFVYGQTEALEIAALEETKLSSATEFFESHPYLALPERLTDRIDPTTARRLARENAAQRARLSSQPRPAGLVAREQAELDEMVGIVVARLSSRPERAHGLYAAAPTSIALGSHLLLHAHVAHFAIVLVFLILLGHHLESAWGSVAMLGLAAVSALGSGGAFVLQHPSGGDPLIGASGVIAGLLAAYAVSAARAGQGLRYAATLVAGALALVVPGSLGFDWSIARDFGSAEPIPGTLPSSLWACAGGLAAGAIFAAGAALLGRRIAPEVREPAPTREAVPGADLQRALQEHRSGAHEDAYRRIESLLRRDPQHTEASLAFWDVCVELGRPADAAPFLLRVLREDVRAGNTERAVHYWLDLVRCELDGQAEPALLLRMASLLRAADEEPAAVRALRFALSRADAADAAAVASRVAREAESLDHEVSIEAAWAALGSVDIDLEERQAIEALLARITAYTGTRLHAPNHHAAGAEYRPAVVERAEEEEPTVPVSEGAAIALDARDRELEIVDAVPLALDEDGLLIEAGGSRKRVRFDRIEALAVAAVEGISEKPVLMIDLLLNWSAGSGEPLKTLRMRTDRFDPRRVVSGKRDALDALRTFNVALASATGALLLPDEQSIRGMPFAAFKSIQLYHRDVLQIDDD